MEEIGTGSDIKTPIDIPIDIPIDTAINTPFNIEGHADAQQRRNYIQQLRWRSRRGLLELELLLQPFASDRLDLLDEDSLANYERLLNCEDLDIYDWLQQRSTPEDDALVNMVTAISDYQQSLKRG